MKMGYALLLLVVVAVLAFVAWPRATPPLPPVVRVADSLIATRTTVGVAIAAERDTDAIHAGRAASHQQRAQTAREAARIFAAAADSLTLAARNATLTNERTPDLQMALEARTAERDSLQAVIRQLDSVVVEKSIQLVAKEQAFQRADDRRRKLEPVLKELRDSLVASRKPPTRWHLLGVTCGVAGIATGLGAGCSVGVSWTP